MSLSDGKGEKRERMREDLEEGKAENMHNLDLLLR